MQKPKTTVAELQRLETARANASNLGLETFSLVVWLAPTVVGVPTIAIWTRYYRRKFAPAARRVQTMPAI